MFANIDTSKAYKLGLAFSECAKEVKADSPTILFAALRVFLITLETITVADKNGKKFPNMMEIIPRLVRAYDRDCPIDTED